MAIILECAISKVVCTIERIVCASVCAAFLFAPLFCLCLVSVCASFRFVLLFGLFVLIFSVSLPR